MVKTSINKDEVNELPLGKYEGRIIIVDTPLQVADAIEEIENENIIGVDTETRPTFKKGLLNKTALVQIATGKKVFLFRLNKMGFPYSLARIFENPQIQKIGIAILQDMKELSDQYREFQHQNVTDLNILCKTLNFQNIGARNLTAMILGFRISKRQQTSNWESNQLSEGQLRYAATDAWVARQVYLKLYTSKEFNF
ncbi:MAG: 3'-5' exonuclease [Flavobacteriales bacterium]|nr:3'-5' exonuclease [Flavobacteriales bacterium]|tara:strand:+ start:2467 stop:3057 length:591 start_codon:yes stop_codon:yes gene_type:complete